MYIIDFNLICQLDCEMMKFIFDTLIATFIENSLEIGNDFGMSNAPFCKIFE